MGTNPFRALIYAMSPTYRQNMSPNGGCHLGRFPRKYIYYTFTKKMIFIGNDQYKYLSKEK